MTNPSSSNTTFDPHVYRQAMGPGYGVATFSEQPALTGQNYTTGDPQTSFGARPRWPFLLRRLMRLVHLRQGLRGLAPSQLLTLQDAAPKPNC